ncbi:MAG TPA: disulfide isomerase DsbC N-terminal domain-containing protein, partial [Casimicrobiaceae bacterium]|nr:disulfide isomerase DsbC N-terminal domain-containing protein [Casimicrobiaceae bacterium]
MPSTLSLARLARPSLPLLLAALTAGTALAQSPAPAAAASPDVAALRKVLSERFPGAEIGAITRTNYLGGLYEVQCDDCLVYTDAKANHVLVGALWDSVAKTN